VYKGRIIDVDVHHTWTSPAELLEYLPGRWRDYFLPERGNQMVRIEPVARHHSLTSGSANRVETEPPTGGPPGSDYDLMRMQLLDVLRPERVVLTFGLGAQAGVPNPELAVQLCRAANDWTIDHWLDGRDERLYGAMLVSTGLPAEGAREIRRLARHPRIVEVLMLANPLNLPFGHPIYHPIYEAAAEVDLAVSIHVGGENTGKGVGSAGGNALSRLEQGVVLEQPGMHHLTSLLVEGVFEKYPTLRVILTEYGFTWLPWVIWGLDSRYKLLQRESSHVRRLPSEYFREHVWLSTQPWEFEPSPGELMSLLEAFGGLEDKLCFSSDYPHWNTDYPTSFAARLPESWRPKVFAENAEHLLGRTSARSKVRAGRRHPVVSNNE
jgi:predicted TIM-barrel fold metal-dependent hydrolase